MPSNMDQSINISPEKMQIIINIQMMSKKVGTDLTFKWLSSRTTVYLRSLQDDLIPLYNEAIKCQKENSKSGTK